MKTSFANFFSNEKSTLWSDLSFSSLGKDILAKPKRSTWDRIVRGSFSQADMPSNYQNSQCTSMAITAVAYNSIKCVSKWTTSDVNFVLKEGDRNHTSFREVFAFSQNQDKRVALDDFPNAFIVKIKDVDDPVDFHKKVGMRMGEWAGLVSTPTESSVYKDGYDEEFQKQCPTFCSVLEQNLKANRPVVATLGEFSVAFFKAAGEIWMFDSHHRSRRGEGAFYDGRAFVAPFSNYDDLEKYLSDTYGLSVYYANTIKIWSPEKYVEKHVKDLEKVEQLLKMEASKKLKEVEEKKNDMTDDLSMYMKKKSRISRFFSKIKYFAKRMKP